MTLFFVEDWEKYFIFVYKMIRKLLFWGGIVLSFPPVGIRSTYKNIVFAQSHAF